VLRRIHRSRRPITDRIKASSGRSIVIASKLFLKGAAATTSVLLTWLGCSPNDRDHEAARGVIVEAAAGAAPVISDEALERALDQLERDVRSERDGRGPR